MPTLAPFAHASLLAPPRKPALKRRKLNHVPDLGCQSGRALTDNSNVAPTPNNPYAKLSCSTCHRALSTATRPGPGAMLCSRCAAPTCAICARTCTSYTRPSSFPPTPALTRSPSPSSMAPVSPKRTALGLSYAAMNRDVSLVAKRKKPPIDKDEGDVDLGSGTRCERDHLDAHAESVVVSGCGRVVCRACCVESVPNDGKLCVDCFALV